MWLTGFPAGSVDDRSTDDVLRLSCDPSVTMLDSALCRGGCADILSAMLSREHVATMLSRADTAWSTVQGVTRQWSRQALVTIAFKRYFDGLPARGVSMATLSATDGRVDVQ